MLALASNALAGTDSGSAVSPAAFDLLSRSAPKTERGARKLLLDVTTSGSRLVAVGQSGLILRSDDQGKNWQQSPAPTAVMLTAISFADEQHGWAVGHDGVILATRDGGASWSIQFTGIQSNQQMLAAALARQARAAALQGDAEATQRQRDQAADMLAAARAAVDAGPSQPLFAVRFLGDAKTGFAAGSFGQLFQTRDAGASWHFIGDRLDNPEGLHLNSLSLSAQGDLLVAAEAGTVFSSRDQGASWRRSDTGYKGHLYGVLAGPAAWLAFGFNGHLFRSSDEGQHWAVLRSPSVKTIVGGSINKNGNEAAVVLLTEDGEILTGSTNMDGFTALPQRVANRKFSAFTLANAGTLVAVGIGGVSVRALAATGSPR